MPGTGGREARFRLSRRRHPAGLRRARTVRRSTTCWCATSRARRTWPTATRAPAAGGRGRGHLGSGRHQHGHRHRHGHAGLLAHRLHHRPGRQQADRLATPSRRSTSPASPCPSPSTTTWSRAPRTSRRTIREAFYIAALRPARAGAGRHHQGRAAGVVRVRLGSGRLRSCRATVRRCSPARQDYEQALELINSAKRPVILAGPRHHHLRRDATKCCELGRARRYSRGADPARPGRASRRRIRSTSA